MADIVLNTGITELTDGNNYIVNSNLDYLDATINCTGVVTITVEDGGLLENATINSAGTVNLKINTSEVAFSNISYSGVFVQKTKITVFSTIFLENYTLPVGFAVETICFENQGDKGGSHFEVIPYASLNHRKHLYPFDPVGTVKPVWIFSQKDKYFAETLGIIPEDASKIDSNARILERYIGRSHIIKFGLGNYFIKDVNVDNCKDWTGAASNYYTVNIEGSNSEQSENKSRTFIITNWSNFIFSVTRPSFRVDLKYLYVYTTADDEYSLTSRNHDRMGYGITRFSSTPVAGVGTPSLTAEIGVSTYKVVFFGFKGAIYSGEWATACSIKSTKFLGCRYGFYTRLSANLSLLEDIQVHQCAFGITTGGTSCVLRRIEVTPENWYRDSEAIATPFFYGYRSNDGFQNCVIEDLYLEDYLADLESRAKFIVYSLSASSKIILKNCKLQTVNSDTSAYHLEIFRNGGYVPVNLQNSSKIADFIEDSDFPTKVKTSENWVITGICKNGSFGYSKQTYSSTTVQFFSGRNLLHFWKGIPTLTLDAVNGYQLKFAETDHKYYAGVTESNEITTAISTNLYNSSTGIFLSPASTLYLKLDFKIKGKTLINKPFVFKIAQLEFTITPYEVSRGVFEYNFKHYHELTTEEFNGLLTSFKIFIKKSDEESNLLSNSLGRMITVENFEFNLYE